VEVPAILLIFRDCFADILVLFYFDTFVFFFFHVALPPYPDYIGQFLETQLFLSINGKPQTTAQNEFRGHLKTQPALSKDVMIKTHASWPFYIGYFHFIEKLNGIKYLYASLDKHPHICSIAAIIMMLATGVW
jgi:hypothetical protein